MDHNLRLRELVRKKCKVNSTPAFSIEIPVYLDLLLISFLRKLRYVSCDIAFINGAMLTLWACFGDTILIFLLILLNILLILILTSRLHAHVNMLGNTFWLNLFKADVDIWRKTYLGIWNIYWKILDNISMPVSRASLG